MCLFRVRATCLLLVPWCTDASEQILPPTTSHAPPPPSIFFLTSVSNSVSFHCSEYILLLILWSAGFIYWYLVKGKASLKKKKKLFNHSLGLPKVHFLQDRTKLQWELEMSSIVYLLKKFHNGSEIRQCSTIENLSFFKMRVFFSCIIYSQLGITTLSMYLCNN